MNSPSRAIAFFALLPALFLLPFAGTPFNIDDTLFVYAARQIREDPLRPYDFLVNWETRSEPMWDVTANPPLVPYVLAAAFALGGESEGVAHLALVPFAMAASALAYALARRYTPRPALGAALFVCSPAFVVCAGSAMSDVPALAFFLAAIALAHTGAARRATVRAFAAGLCLGLAAVAKYQSVVGLAVVAAIFVAERRRAAAWVAFAAGFAALFGGWAALGLATHGSAHLLDTVTRGGRQGADAWSLVRRAVSSATFTSASLTSLLVIVPAIVYWTRREVHAVVAVLAAATAGAALLRFAKPVRADLAYLTGSVTLAAVVLLAVTLCAAGLVLQHVAARRRAVVPFDAEAPVRTPPLGARTDRLLVIWALVVPSYVVLCTYWVAVRYLLPGLVPVAFLAAIGLERAAPSRRARRAIATAALVLGVVSAILVANAERRFAAFYRDGVGTALALVPPGSRVLFDGHWGFQYYMERRGVRALEFGADDLAPGDYVIAAEQTRALDIAEYPGVFSLVKLIEAPAAFPLVTMHRRANAGFHADVYGVLPFAISRQSPDRIAVLRVNDAR